MRDLACRVVGCRRRQCVVPLLQWALMATTAERATRYTSINVHQRHVDRANAMAAHLGINRNQMFRFLIDNVTDEDLDRLWARSSE